MAAQTFNLTDATTEAKASLFLMSDFNLATRLEEHLSNFINDLQEKRIEKVAARLLARSYWHPNGFLKIPVARDADGGFFRLHYWPSNSSGGAKPEDIHSHRWNYFSKVLKGSMEVKYFEERNTKDGIYSKYSCSPNQKGSYRMDLCGKVALDTIKTTALRAGDIHFGRTNTIHSTMVLGADCVITAFFQTCSTSSRSYVYRKGWAFSTAHEERKPASIENIKEVIELIANK